MGDPGMMPCPLVPLVPFAGGFFIMVWIEIEPGSPLAGIMDPADTSAALAAASWAFSSLNWRYVFVLGTVSDRNSRLSILETALATD